MIDTSKTMGIILSNMQDEMLGDVTEHRTMASIPYGGRYRLVDFTLSNMVNSGITDVGIITKSNYQSLMDHLGNGREWGLARKKGGLFILPPFGRSGSGIYRGSLDALIGIRSFIERIPAGHILLTCCDIIASVDYRPFIEEHIRSQADITVLYQQRAGTNAKQNDIAMLKTDADGRVIEVLLNPRDNAPQSEYLNIAILSKKLLLEIIEHGASRGLYSFVRDVLQAQCHSYRIHARELAGYSAKIDSVQSLFAANMALHKAKVREALFLQERPIFTKVRDDVPTRYGLDAQVAGSLIADGCIIEGRVENSVLFRGVKVGKGAVVRNCVLMQGTEVGERANLDYIMTDKDVLIKPGRSLMGFDTYPVYIKKGSSV